MESENTVNQTINHLQPKTKKIHNKEKKKYKVSLI